MRPAVCNFTAFGRKACLCATSKNCRGADWEIISFVRTLCHAARRREFRGRFPVFREKTHHQYVLTNHLPHWSKRLAAKSDNLCSVPSALGRQQEALWCCAEFVQKFLAEAYLVFFQVRLRSCTRQRWTQLCAPHIYLRKKWPGSMLGQYLLRQFLPEWHLLKLGLLVALNWQIGISIPVLNLEHISDLKLAESRNFLKLLWARKLRADPYLKINSIYALKINTFHAFFPWIDTHTKILVKLT